MFKGFILGIILTLSIVFPNVVSDILMGIQSVFVTEKYQEKHIKYKSFYEGYESVDNIQK